MIKRVNKLTALLVAATSVASIAPMTSAHAATKLETLEAVVESVQAFDGGKYIFDGYRNDEQDSATYFFDGKKDIEIEDVDGDSFVKYGKEFVSFNNSKETLLNLSNGKVDEDTVSDKIAYMQTKFNTSVIKKVKKYTNNEAKLQDITVADQIDGNQFGEVWYGYTTSAQVTTYAGYVSSKGKYIDATETANVVYYVQDGELKGKKIEFDKMSDTKTVDGKTYSLEVGKTLFADSDNIYRVVKVVGGTKEVSYIQKLSKAQGETVDGAYIPKEVVSYEISDEVLNNIEANSAVRVVNKSIYTVDFNKSAKEITMKKYDFVKERDDASDAITKDRVYKVKEDEDFDDIDNEEATAYDIDVNGNVWVLCKGKIQKVVKGKLTTMYTVDRTMNEISVYDDNDIVAWNTENEIYATVAGKETSEEEVKEEEKKVEVVAGWAKNSDGTWSYNKVDGTKATGWLNDNGTWYYLNNNGIMQTGWVNLNGTWYFLQSSGAMKTGWLNDNGTWYYLQSSGAMKTGWLNDNGTWYYLNSNGSMAANTTVDGYRLGSNGAWIR
ncbi:MAG: N-acetylmuramoyl-L-alanine amidase family protein [Clostridium butyricum]|nr:N-acetylmuramoyl-L-alanine amidase family protein [Clostridium butyricum]